MGATAAMAGCVSSAAKICSPGAMTSFAVPALKRVRVGICGLGMRGPGAVHRLAAIPGVDVVALCDLFQQRVDAQNDWLTREGKPKAASYTGEEGY